MLITHGHTGILATMTSDHQYIFERRTIYDYY